MSADGEQPATGKRTRTANDDGERGSRKAHRKRAALACDECRVRKRRCDGAIPACGGCTKRLSTCVYSSEVEASAWQTR
ncbi:Zn(II)2Cys6 transcription factor [Candidatus Bathyarchaeota archaeon]|nr:Zn(II)2Cys6 transcription factor [Candidatus Bathyarchaeota archaeon]